MPCTIHVPLFSSSYYIDKVDGSLSLYGVAAISNLLSSSIDLSTITSLSVHYIDVTDLMSSLLVPVKDKLVKLKVSVKPAYLW